MVGSQKEDKLWDYLKILTIKSEKQFLMKIKHGERKPTHIDICTTIGSPPNIDRMK